MEDINSDVNQLFIKVERFKGKVFGAYVPLGTLQKIPMPNKDRQSACIWKI